MARVSHRTALVVLAAAGLAVRPAQVLACCGPVSTYADVLARARVVILADVSGRYFDGAAYDLTVETVYRGVAASPFRIGPSADPGIPPTCGLTFDVGDRVVLALENPQDLGEFAGAAWIIASDATLRTEGSVSGSPSTTAKLLADLANLPDTALHSSPALPDATLGRARDDLVGGAAPCRIKGPEAEPVTR